MFYFRFGSFRLIGHINEVGRSVGCQTFAFFVGERDGGLLEKLCFFLLGIFIHELESLYEFSLVYSGIGSLLQFLNKIFRFLQVHA